MMWFKAHWLQLLLWAGFIFAILRIYVSGRLVRFLDRANHRSLHRNEILTGGGFFLFMPLVALMLWQQLYLPAALVFCLSFVGLIDDVKNLSPRFRFLIQIVVVVITLWWLGFALTAWSLLIGLVFLWWLNLFNFMDGANGLVALHAIVTLTMMLIMSVFSESWQLTVVFLVIALCVYLYFNVLLKNLFMGDSGSLALAFIIAWTALLALTMNHLTVWQISVMHAVLITDATLTLAVRWYCRERLTEAHRSHLYQRLIAQNRPHGRIALFYAATTLVCCGVAVLMQNQPTWQQIVWFGLVYGLLTVVFFHCRGIGR